MYAKVSHRGLRFFQHAPGAPTCTLALESIAHHLLKLELANAARAAGVDAEMEVRGPDGTWRADVMASDPGGAWRVALEAQLAPITAGDITARTERMRVNGVPSIWFSDRPKPPWLVVVPSVRLAQADDSEHLVIAAGLVKFDGYWQAVPASLADFLRWAFTGRIVTYSPVGCVLEGFATVWTAPRYAGVRRIPGGAGPPCRCRTTGTQAGRDPAKERHQQSRGPFGGCRSRTGGSRHWKKRDLVALS